MFSQDFSCPDLLVVTHYQLVFVYGAITRYGRHFQGVLLSRLLNLAGWSHFARHYSGNLG